MFRVGGDPTHEKIKEMAQEFLVFQTKKPENHTLKNEQKHSTKIAKKNVPEVTC